MKKLLIRLFVIFFISIMHAQNVAIVVHSDATELERYAAKELCRYIDKLYGVKVQPSTQLNKAQLVIFIATKAHLPAEAKPLALPDLSEQGIFIHPFKQGDTQCLLLTGGSPVAVLWSVYELVERWGVRYLIYEDVFPKAPGKLTFPESDIRLEPNMRIRCWRLVNVLPEGPVSWSLDENKRFIHQIIKMKFNRVLLALWPAQPFVDYSFRGMKKPPPVFYFGEHFPIDSETIGREHFEKNMTEFINPDFLGADTPKELVKRGTHLIHGILAEAKRFGMEAGIGIQPFEWPKEFMKVLPGSEPVHQLGNLTAGPGKSQSIYDPLLREMVATIFRAYVDTYPEADYIAISVPEHRAWTEQARQAYKMLDAKYNIKSIGTFDELCARARSRTSFPRGGGKRVENMLKSDLAALAFLDSLIAEKNLLAAPGDGANIKLIYSGITAELFPLLAKIMPKGGEVLSFIDYTASRQLKQIDLLRQRPPKGLPTCLTFTLADDNVGILPQLATGSLDKIMRILRKSGWSGYLTRYWTVGDLIPTIHYLASASWDSSVTPESAYLDLFTHVTGKAAAKPAIRALKIIEKITIDLDQYGLGFGFPIPDLMTKHYKAGGLPAPIKADHQRYREALDALRIARERSDPRGYPLLDYLIGRVFFAVRFLDAAEAFGATAVAEKAGNHREAVRHIEEAYIAIREAIQAWANVARDHGDLGAVAMLNKYCYRPIRDKRDELLR